MEMQPEHPSKISDPPKIHLTSLPGTDNGKMLRRGTPHNPRGGEGGNGQSCAFSPLSLLVINLSLLKNQR